MKPKLSTKVFFTLSLLFVSLIASAQVPAGRSKIVTLYSDYRPGIVNLVSGKASRQSRLNVFLKNSTLVAKQGLGKDILEVDMHTVKSVTIAGVNFINLNNRLAEIVAVDSVGGTQLVRIRTIDIDAMKSEAVNNSNISNIDLSASSSTMGVTRMDIGEDEEPYPLIDTFYYLHNGKTTRADERDIRHAIGKKKSPELDKLMAWEEFSWGSERSLIRILQLFR